MKVEIWKDILGYEGIYKVSNLGRIKSVGTRISSRIMKTHTRKRDGYVCVGLQFLNVRRTIKVHRAVAEAFIPNPNKLPEIDHKNGVRNDNNKKNLRWITKLKNSHNRCKVHGEIPLLGVSISSSNINPYRASICTHGHKRLIGVFPTAEAAHRAYLKAKREEHV